MTEALQQGDQWQLGHYFQKDEQVEVLSSSKIPRDGFAVPFDDIRSMLKSFPYGHPFRVMTLFKAISGMRNTELINLSPKLRSGNWQYIKLGKNQKSWRMFYVPDYVWEEYMHYRLSCGVPNAKFWHITASTYKRWCSKIRCELPPNWQTKCDIPINRGGKNNLQLEEEYNLQFKGLRTTYATHYFWRMMRQYNNNVHLAGMLTQKHMKHAGDWMTLTHYVENGDRINAKYWSQFEIWDLFRLDSPTTLTGGDIK